jgi:hypothetical protein
MAQFRGLRGHIQTAVKGLRVGRGMDQSHPPSDAAPKASGLRVTSTVLLQMVTA